MQTTIFIFWSRHHCDAEYERHYYCDGCWHFLSLTIYQSFHICSVLCESEWNTPPLFLVSVCVHAKVMAPKSKPKFSHQKEERKKKQQWNYSILISRIRLTVTIHSLSSFFLSVYVSVCVWQSVYFDLILILLFVLFLSRFLSSSRRIFLKKI